MGLVTRSVREVGPAVVCVETETDLDNIDAIESKSGGGSGSKEEKAEKKGVGENKNEKGENKNDSSSGMPINGKEDSTRGNIFDGIPEALPDPHRGNNGGSGGGGGGGNTDFGQGIELE